MKTLVVVYALYTLRLGKCVSQVNSPGTKVSLDLTQVDSSKVNVTSKSLYGVKNLILEGKEGLVISSVTKGGQGLWKETDGTKFSAVKLLSRNGHQSILSLHLVDANQNPLEKLFVDDGDWREIQMDEFKDRYEAMKRGIAASKSKAGTLDISNVDFARVNVNEKEKDGVTHRDLTPKGELFTNVFDLSRPLWTSKRGEKSPKVHLYAKGDRMLLTVTIIGGRSPEAHFEKQGSVWKSVTKEEFSVSLEKLNSCEVKETNKSKEKEANPVEKEVKSVEKDAEKSGPDPVLNLDKADPNVVVNKGKVGDVSFTSYFLKECGFFKKVLDKSLNIWAGNDYERCSVVNVYKKGVAVFLSLRIRNGSEAGFLCFKRVGDKWEKITEDEFDRDLDSKSEEEDKPKSGIMTSGPYLMVIQVILAVYFMNFWH